MKTMGVKSILNNESRLIMSDFINYEVIKCRDCKQDFKRRETHKNSHGQTVYEDDHGMRTIGFRCNPCVRLMMRAINRKNGHKPIDEVAEHRNAIGRKSEHMARELFESLGFSVEMTTKNGPDLIATLGDSKIKIEVKTALKRPAGGWGVGKVHGERKLDDIIAIVFPTGLIHLEKMSDHLMRCSESGSRPLSYLLDQDRIHPSQYPTENSEAVDQ